MKGEALLQITVYLVENEREWYATCIVCRPCNSSQLIAIHACIASEIAAHVYANSTSPLEDVCFYVEWFVVTRTEQDRVYRDLYWERQHPKGSYPPVLKWEFDGVCLTEIDRILGENRNGKV